ncbi:MAG: YbaB/EbfC family nucleoid-associated protein, partial [Crocinitomicaceae bacterium]
MFGFNQDELLKKIQEAAEESKKKLAETIVTGEAGGGLIRIELDGNRNFKSFTLNTSLEHMEKEDLEDLLSVAFSRALEEAN